MLGSGACGGIGDRPGPIRFLGVLAILLAQGMLWAQESGGGKGLDPVVVKGVGFQGLSGKTVSERKLLEQKVTFAVGMARNSEVYYAESEGADLPRKTLTLGEIGKASGDRLTILTAAAMQEVMQAASKGIQEEGFGAVRVSMTKRAIDELLAGKTGGVLYFTVTEGVVGEVGTVVKGVDGEEKSGDGSKYEAIREKSPVQEGDPVNVEEVDEYLARLNRNPSKQVETEIRPGERPGEVKMDYVVHELKPWQFYFSLDNTGTEETEELRERFSFRLFDVTGRDDVLSLDYVTADFDSVHQVVGSYECPLQEISYLGLLRGRLYGSWAQYMASEIGLFNTDLSGTSTQVGGELKGILWQERSMFLDGLAGVRFTHVTSENDLISTEGKGSFLFGYAGLQLDYRSGGTVTNGSLILELGGTRTDEEDLEPLGRSEPSKTWCALKYNLDYSTYLDWSVPYTEAKHEVFASLRGQYVFGDARVSPSFMYPMGGLYSVRGYPQWIVAGDNAVVLTAEYRFHLAPLLKRSKDKPASWDLVPKAFVDIGRTTYNDAFSYEKDRTLTSAGVGLNLRIRKNLFAQIDVGVPLKSMDNGTESVDKGDAMVHFAVGVNF